MPPSTDVTSADLTSTQLPSDKRPARSVAGVSLNLSALAEENMGLAIAALETAPIESAESVQESDEESGEQAGEQPIVLPPASETAMEDYRQLQQNLLKLTLAFTFVICLVVWKAYSLNIALNYVIGAVTGIVYFKMLAKSVGAIGREAPKPSSARLAVFVGVMVASTQWQQLSVLPVFLGFLTYKVALIAFVIWTAALPHPEPTS